MINNDGLFPDRVLKPAKHRANTETGTRTQRSNYALLWAESHWHFVLTTNICVCFKLGTNIISFKKSGIAWKSGFYRFPNMFKKPAFTYF